MNRSGFQNVFQQLKIPFRRSEHEDSFDIPGTPVGTGVLKTLKIAIFGRHEGRGEIHRTTIRVSLLQTIHVSVSGRRPCAGFAITVARSHRSSIYSDILYIVSFLLCSSQQIGMQIVLTAYRGRVVKFRCHLGYRPFYFFLVIFALGRRP